MYISKKIFRHHDTNAVARERENGAYKVRRKRRFVNTYKPLKATEVPFYAYLRNMLHHHQKTYIKRCS